MTYFIILLLQLSILIFYLISFLIYICKSKRELSKLEKIDKDDKGKFYVLPRNIKKLLNWGTRIFI